MEESGSIIVQFRATTHTEHTTCRLRAVIPGNDSILVGFWVAVDFDGRITAGSEVLSDRPFDESRVRQLTRDAVEVEPASYVMRLAQ